MVTHNAPAPAPGGRIAVAMSGGVDSSVAAALLVSQGHDVVGVHLKLHELPAAQRRDRSCCSLDDALDARQACARLGIPFYVLDAREAFARNVIDYFVGDYVQGRTPNPCVMCNKTIKSALLLEKVRAIGCTALATGHYARVTRREDDGRYVLARPADRRKDQTYFLFATSREELPHLRFPLAEFDKPAARALAQTHGLLTWNKPDSQEVCFVPADYRAFLRERLGAARPGAFVDRAGRELGRHEGLPFYTVGQRRGLGVSGARPYYVVALDAVRNQVVLGSEAELFGDRLRVAQVNWVSCDDPPGPLRATVKVRYAHAGTPATLTPRGDTWLVRFDAPVRAITPGQAAAFYDGDVLLGGGWIVGDGPEAP
ncbi:MAG: tRNA 2-thiouridine(34) synthase MnmA [Candidatus Lambdaproteobacteria bacterium]|nr:tRNA 2-thiouridine(34) synthase MnmA [Candidatus Lambdaproteobacteria bacterium]